MSPTSTVGNERNACATTTTARRPGNWCVAISHAAPTAGTMAMARPSTATISEVQTMNQSAASPLASRRNAARVALPISTAQAEKVCSAAGKLPSFTAAT